MKEKLTTKIVRFVFSATLSIACLFSTASMAQTKVVVIPLGADSKPLEPFTPLAASRPADSDYAISATTVIDKITGLEWQRLDDNTTRTWDDARDYCVGLTLDSKKWRLPSISELMSIVNLATSPRINVVAFPSTNSSTYWASPTAAGFSSTHAWNLNFGTGESASYIKSNNFYVRCVRSSRPIGPVLQNNNNGTVTDLATSLTWQQVDDGVRKTWTVAVSYCDSLSLGGKNDWRLPSIKEITSIVDTRIYEPAIDSTMFPSAKSLHYWSAISTTNPAWAWTAHFYRGWTLTLQKTSTTYALCVR